MASTSQTSPKIIAAASGKRKRSTASVRLHSGKGQVTVNGKPANEYFTNTMTVSSFTSPLIAAGVDKKYDVSALVFGGGLTGQLDALTLGISRALVKVSDKHKGALRSQGLLTRDSRKRQRRMVGTGGKARRKKAISKALMDLFHKLILLGAVSAPMGVAVIVGIKMGWLNLMEVVDGVEGKKVGEIIHRGSIVGGVEYKIT